MFNFDSDKAFSRGHQTPADVQVQGVRLAGGSAASARAPRTSREAEKLLVAELLDEVRLLRQTNTQIAAQLRGQLVNGVLESAVDVMDANGILTRTYNVMCGSLVVVNLTAAQITIQNGPAGSSAPAKGRGLQIVPASSFFTVPVASNAWTIYGTAGGTISFQAFTGLQAYGANR